MARIAFILGAVLGLLTGPAAAGQTSASFGAGIVIGGPAKPARFYTWGAASVSLRKAGYKDIERAEREGSLYWFLARKGEYRYRIAVSATTGNIETVTPA